MTFCLVCILALPGFGWCPVVYSDFVLGLLQVCMDEALLQFEVPKPNRDAVSLC